MEMKGVDSKELDPADGGGRAVSAPGGVLAGSG